MSRRGQVHPGERCRHRLGHPRAHHQCRKAAQPSCSPGGRAAAGRHSPSGQRSSPDAAGLRRCRCSGPHQHSVRHQRPDRRRRRLGTGQRDVVGWRLECRCDRWPSDALRQRHRLGARAAPARGCLSARARHSPSGRVLARPSTLRANLGHARSPPFTACVLGTAVDTRAVRLVVLGQLLLPRVHAQQASESLSHDRLCETSQSTAMQPKALNC